MGENKNGSGGGNGNLSPLGRAVGQVALAVISAGIIGMGALTYSTAVAYAQLESRVAQSEDKITKFKEIQEKMREDIIKLRLQNERLRNDQK